MRFVRRLGFNLWYYFQPPWDSGVSPPELLEFIESHPPGRAIDLGCGSGTNVITLARSGWQVTGVDFAPRAISLAKRKAREAEVTANLSLGDVTRLRDITEPFDLALDLGCFHSLSMPERVDYLHSLDRLLAPGGHWLMYGFFKTDAGPGPGLRESDLELASLHLSLVWRREGSDKRGRPSAWFLFQKSSL